MKFFAVVLIIAQAVLIQNACSQVIRAAPISVAPPTQIIVQPSVANTLADTLSLLTVSSLLAETLPLNPTVIATMPVSSPAISYGGCGCGNYYNYIY